MIQRRTFIEHTAAATVADTGAAAFTASALGRRRRKCLKAMA